MIQSPTTPLLPIEIHLQPPLRTKLERERQAFQRLLAELKKKFYGKYVAIHNEQVAEVGADRLETAMRALQRVGNVDLYVGLVSDEPEPLSRTGKRKSMT